MKNKTFMVIIFALILIAGCTNGTDVKKEKQVKDEDLPDKTIKPYIVISIQELNEDAVSYTGEKVLLEGFFGHKNFYGNTGMSYLITDYGLFLVDQPLPVKSFVRLDGEIPVEHDSKQIKVIGIVQQADDKITVIVVESFEVKE